VESMRTGEASPVSRSPRVHLVRVVIAVLRGPSGCCKVLSWSRARTMRGKHDGIAVRTSYEHACLQMVMHVIGLTGNAQELECRLMTVHRAKVLLGALSSSVKDYLGHDIVWANRRPPLVSKEVREARS
jgi:hypothetical protein